MTARSGCCGRGLPARGSTATRCAPRLGAGRERAFDRLGEWLPQARGRSLIEGVRLALASLPEDSEPAEILATLPVAIAALAARASWHAAAAPDPARGTADDLLAHGARRPGRAGHGRSARHLFRLRDRQRPQHLGLYRPGRRLERASLVSAALGAYCAFTGPLHGGAPGPTLDMLDEAEASGDVAAWAERKLAAGERLMGFGHRVFRLGDPRATVLHHALDRMGETLGPGIGRLAFAAEVERAVGAAFARLKPGRPPLQPNVEINAALLLDAVGFPRDAFTPVFAIGARRRLAGARNGAATSGAADPPVLVLCRAAPGNGSGRGLTPRSVAPLPVDHVVQRPAVEIRAQVVAEQFDRAMAVVIAVRRTYAA